jgi:hypothetical protein
MISAYGKSSVSAVAPLLAGMTAARIGTRRPPRPGIHRGTTSPHSLISPMVRYASASLTTLSATTYHAPVNTTGPWPRTSVAVRSSSGPWKLIAAIRQMQEGTGSLARGIRICTARKTGEVAPPWT